MKKYTYLIATGLVLGALSPRQSNAAQNTWNNGSGNSQWDDTSANWSSPAVWADGADAVFDTTGVGTVTLTNAIVAGSVSFSADGYTLEEINGYNSVNNTTGSSLTASDITTVANATTTLAVVLNGTSGLTINATTPLVSNPFGTNILVADQNESGNVYTGGTFVRNGTLVLAAFPVSYSGLPAGWAVDSIEALDAGATVKFGTLSATQPVASGQFPYNQGTFPCRLNLTGGTFDLNGDNGNNRVPVPSGIGTIVNSSSFQNANLVMSQFTDVTNEFDGSIADGGDSSQAFTNLANGTFPYRLNVDLHYVGNGTLLILGGSNSYSGSTRIGSGTIKLVNGGTLGNPGYIPGVTGPSRIYGNLDLGGTPLVKLGGFKSITPNTYNGVPMGTIFNSSPCTLSIFSFGWGDTGNLPIPAYGYGGTEGVNANAFVDNMGTGGRLGLTKVGTNTINFNGTWAPYMTYSGPTTVLGGVMGFEATTAVSPNTVIFLSGGSISLDYTGIADVQGLVIDGVPQPAGTYAGGSNPKILGTGSINVLKGPSTVWNNGSGNFQWDYCSANWGGPSLWSPGLDANFGATAAGAVNLADAVSVHDMTFSADGYTINGNGNFLTLVQPNPTLTASHSASIAASLHGTQGLTVQGTSDLTLLGDSSYGLANQYTGGTYVKSGTLILRATGVSSAGQAYAVDSIQELDPGALVQIGTLNDGSVNTVPGDGQLMRGNNTGRLNLTGGTFDNNGDNNSIQYPPPEGTGIVVNSSPYIRGVLKLQGGNTGKTYVFNGQIKDGGLNVTTPQGIAYQENIDMNGSGPYTMVLGGSNSFTGFLRLNSGGNGNKVVLMPGGTLGYAAPINCPSRQILMNSGTIDLNGTSQKVGYVYTGNNSDSIITNSAFGTVSTLTVCYNCTNLVPYVNSGFTRGIRTGLLDDPTTGGTLALVKEGVALQPIGNQTGDFGNALPCNYHGDTTVNNGILEVLSTNGISPNSAYRLNTTQGKLQLDYTDTAIVRQLYINGVQQPNGVYGSAQTSAITGPGTLTVVGAVVPPNLVFSASGDGSALNFSWSGTGFKLQVQTNSLGVGLSNHWFDYPGGGASPVNVTVDKSQGVLFFRLSN